MGHTWAIRWDSVIQQKKQQKKENRPSNGGNPSGIRGGGSMAYATNWSFSLRHVQLLNRIAIDRLRSTNGGPDCEIEPAAVGHSPAAPPRPDPLHQQPLGTISRSNSLHRDRNYQTLEKNPVKTSDSSYKTRSNPGNSMKLGKTRSNLTNSTNLNGTWWNTVKPSKTQ